MHEDEPAEEAMASAPHGGHATKHDGHKAQGGKCMQSSCAGLSPRGDPETKAADGSSHITYTPFNASHYMGVIFEPPTG